MIGSESSLAKRLERTRDVRDLLLAVVLAAPAHELEVVDDDQPEVGRRIASQAARASAQLEHRQRRRVVDVDRRLAELADGLGDLRVLAVLDVADAHAREVELCERAEHAHDELVGRHFEREDRDADVGLQRDVRGDVQTERRLSHARAAGDDDQVGGLEAGGHPVEIGEARSARR